MVHDTLVKSYIVNNRTEEPMLQLMEFATTYNKYSEFWLKLEDEAHECFRKHRLAVHSCFKKDAPISVRIEVILVEDIDAPAPIDCFENPSIHWDIPIDVLLKDAPYDLESHLAGFRTYVEDFMYAADNSTLHYMGFTDDLPGFLFDNNTKELLLLCKCNKHQNVPNIELKFHFPNSAVDCVSNISIPYLKGYDIHFDKKLLRKNLRSELITKLEQFEERPKKVTAIIATWAIPKPYTIFEVTADGLADILSEHVKETIMPLYILEEDEEEED